MLLEYQILQVWLFVCPAKLCRWSQRLVAGQEQCPAFLLVWGCRGRREIWSTGSIRGQLTKIYEFYIFIQILSICALFRCQFKIYISLSWLNCSMIQILVQTLFHHSIFFWFTITCSNVTKNHYIFFIFHFSQTFMITIMNRLKNL